VCWRFHHPAAIPPLKSEKPSPERLTDRPETPRLIICDYRLRDNETGSTVIERLRNEYNTSIPGMLITGDTAPDRIKEAQASGYLLLHKPVSNAVLRAAIVRLMDSSG